MSSTHDQPAYTGTPSGDSGRQYVPPPATGYDKQYPAGNGPSTGALSLTMMAAVLMTLSGMWSFFEGLAALIRQSFFVVLPNYAFNISVTGWGWIHLITGIVVFAGGLCLFRDMMWARMLGVVLAMVSAVLNFLWIPYYPVWSIVVIAIDVFVIWALMSPRRGYA
jgi:hypothetical protein